MSYIAVDTFGDEYIYPFKPERNILKNKLGEEWGYWESTGCYHIEVPKGTARALYNANLMVDCKIPLYKRDMNWGDNPIQLK